MRPTTGCSCNSDASLGNHDQKFDFMVPILRRAHMLQRYVITFTLITSTISICHGQDSKTWDVQINY